MELSGFWPPWPSYVIVYDENSIQLRECYAALADHGISYLERLNSKYISFRGAGDASAAVDRSNGTYYATTSILVIHGGNRRNFVDGGSSSYFDTLTRMAYKFKGGTIILIVFKTTSTAISWDHNGKRLIHGIARDRWLNNEQLKANEADYVRTPTVALSIIEA